MYNTFDCEIAHQTGIHRFMIDHRYQAKGIARRAMEEALLEIRCIPNLECITICYHPENALAQPFYASFGFTELGLDDDGEMIAAINLV